MADDAATTDFRPLYVRNLKALIGGTYADDEFLYPHDPPWPQESFDYPYGQAPAIDEVPAAETLAWEMWVGSYYQAIALGLDQSPSTNGIVEFLEGNLKANGLRGYADLPDEVFRDILTEGLYSKFLTLPDAADVALFGIPSNDGYQYLKSDFSCMRVVETTWEGEHVAPTIAIVRRPITGSTYGAYQLYKVAITGQGKGFAPPDVRVLTPDGSDAWFLAKYFVLQGAIHRVNLIDHVKVHFPHDVINAVTKSVLPQWHPIHQLLVPHFFLTLPVNNAVLEGPRSLINRDTWYPWSPFAAKGDEIRKLLPFSWAGSQYYFTEPDPAFPAYRFSNDPTTIPDPGGGGSTPSFIGLDVSVYARFQRDYWRPILDYTTKVVATLPNRPTVPAQCNDLVWLEIQHWAYEISRFLPGFPDWETISKPGELEKALAMVIWNAAVVHSCDHAVLHTMMSNPTKPVPFILRVTPTESQTTLGAALGEGGKTILNDVLVAMGVGGLKKEIDGIPLPIRLAPLCQPTDVLWAQMTDLLFYRPHNASLLIDCEYAFTAPGAKSAPPKWPNRPVPKVAALQQARADLQVALREVDRKYFTSTAPVVGVAQALGLPRVEPPGGSSDPKTFRVTQCIGAGIQY